MAEALLEARKLGKRFGALQALDGVDVAVRPGSFHGLIGPNGSGKSTLLKAIAGAHLPDAGTIAFAGRDITRALPYERARQGLCLKFQITAVMAELSVYDNVLLASQSRERLPSLLGSRSRRRADREVMGALERFRLAHRADDLAGELSHGEQQWLEIAMAMATKPKVLLLDEPTGGMSPQERARTGELIRAAAQECAVVMVEHDLDFIRGLCDRITVLHQGTNVATGTPSAIESDPKVAEVYLTRV